MPNIYDTLRRTDHVNCSLDDDSGAVFGTRGHVPLLRARIECVNQLGETILATMVRGIEVRPTSDHEANVYLNSRRGRAAVREYLGSTDDRLRIPFEEQIAVMELGRQAGFPSRSEVYGDLSSIDLLRGLAENHSRFAGTPELRAARETVLWDDSWYADVEAFAVDFEELGGDATDGAALQAFVDQRLSEDFQAFLAATEEVLGRRDGASLLMALETTRDSAGFTRDSPVEGLPATVTSGTLGRALEACDSVRLVDYMGDLTLEAPPHSFVLRRIDEEQAATVRRINSGIERGSSRAQVWEHAGRLWLGRELRSLEQDRSVAIERPVEERWGNEPLSTQIEGARDATHEEGRRDAGDREGIGR